MLSSHDSDQAPHHRGSAQPSILTLPARHVLSTHSPLNNPRGVLCNHKSTSCHINWPLACHHFSITQVSILVLFVCACAVVCMYIILGTGARVVASIWMRACSCTYAHESSFLVWQGAAVPLVDVLSALPKMLPF